MTSAAMRAWIGIGSNLDNPLAQVRQALDALAALPDCSGLQCSSLYRTPPLGPPGQPDYINAVCTVDTGLSPRQLLRQLQALETRQGRVRTERWGPRTLDLDLLLYGPLVMDDQELTIPHPRLRERAFVLLPMLELLRHLNPAGGTRLDGVGDLQALLREVDCRGVEKVSKFEQTGSGG